MRRSSALHFLAPAARFWLGIALSFASPVVPPELVSSAWAQPTAFEGAAMVPVLGQSDVVKARGQALTEAMSRALEQAVLEVMPEARSRVYLVSGRARDYVTTYRVLQEGEVAGQFQIRIEAQIDLPRLQRDLGVSSPSAAASPTTIYLCTTQTTPAGAAALEAARAQLKATVPSVEIAPPAQCQTSPDFAALPGAAALLILTPSNTPAELLRGPQPAVYGAAGRGHVQLLRPSREAVSESGDATGFGPDAATAESEAGRQAAVAALARVQSRVSPLVRNGSGVLVRIENVGSFRAYQQLVRVLSALPGVTRLEPRRFLAPGRSGAAEGSSVQLLLQTSAPVDSLAATLGRTPLTGLRLQVMPVNEGELRVLCAPEGAVPSAVQPADGAEASDSEKQVSPQ